MSWKVEFDSSADKQLRKIDRMWQKRIVDYLEEIAAQTDPRCEENRFEAA